MKRFKRIWCWLVGHRGYDGDYPFSRRVGICARCGCICASLVKP